MTITLTTAAATRVREYLSVRGYGEGLRLGVKTTGCSGLAYVVDYADKIDEKDSIYVSQGVNVIVDSDSVKYLDGTEIDYQADGLSAVFQFKNPNTKDECGCGERFTVD